jgi:hypothetical protein
MAEARTHTGGCHCGKVRFQVTLDLAEPALDDLDLQALPTRHVDGKSR